MRLLPVPDHLGQGEARGHQIEDGDAQERAHPGVGLQLVDADGGRDHGDGEGRDRLAVEGGVLFGTKDLKFNRPIAALYFFDFATQKVNTVFGGQFCSNGKFLRRDAEGATHLVTVEVDGLRDYDEARRVAKAIADSPLVKTAIYGADPNWGRIVSAAGYAGVEARGSEDH